MEAARILPSTNPRVSSDLKDPSASISSRRAHREDVIDTGLRQYLIRYLRVTGVLARIFTCRQTSPAAGGDQRHYTVTIPDHSSSATARYGICTVTCVCGRLAPGVYSVAIAE